MQTKKSGIYVKPFNRRVTQYECGSYRMDAVFFFLCRGGGGRGGGQGKLLPRLLTCSFNSFFGGSYLCAFFCCKILHNIKSKGDNLLNNNKC